MKPIVTFIIEDNSINCVSIELGDQVMNLDKNQWKEVVETLNMKRKVIASIPKEGEYNSEFVTLTNYKT